MMKNSLKGTLLCTALITSIGLTGCGGSSNSSTPSPTPTPTPLTNYLSVNTASGQVVLPQAVEINANQPTGDFDGKLFINKVAGTGTAGQVQGAVAEITVTAQQAQDLQTLISALMSKYETELQKLAASINLTQISVNVSQAGTAQGSFLIEVPQGQNINLQQLFAQFISVNLLSKAGGAVVVPTQPGATTAVTKARINISTKNINGKVVVVITLVDENNQGLYEVLINDLSSVSNISLPSVKFNSATEEFTVAQTSKKADFLFVVDNSGSMGDDQAAIQKAADSFVNVIQSSGLDYQLGVITTDSDIPGEFIGDKGFTNDLAKFKVNLLQGTSGDSTESGVYWAEKSLMANGGVVKLGYPRAGASLSVIMLSDETEQYTSYSGGKVFDPVNNLFMQNGYRVYSIISLEQYIKDAPNSFYDELAINTGGSVADIANLNSFDAIMKDIAQKAGAAAAGYKLAKPAISGYTTVKVNGTVVPQNATNGWQYVPSTQSIVFSGTAIPTAGSKISVTYYSAS